MDTQKLAAAWRIVVSLFSRSLEARMKLVIHIQKFLEALVEDLNEYAAAKGELHTLQALRAITEEKIEQNGRQ